MTKNVHSGNTTLTEISTQKKPKKLESELIQLA